MRTTATVCVAIGTFLLVWADVARPETIATGCVNNSSGAVSRVRPFGSTPRAECPGDDTVTTFRALEPGVTQVNGLRVLEAPGELTILVRAPFTLVLTMDEAGVCRVNLVGDPAGMPFQVPGPAGSTLIDPGIVTTLLTAAADDVAGDLTDQEYISVGRASLLLTDLQLTNVAGETCRAGVEAQFSRPHFQRFTR
jgi:hypothetical protein